MGLITFRQLQQWATMLQLNDAFDWSGEDEEQIIREAQVSNECPTWSD